MGRHDVVKTRTGGLEATASLGIVLAADETHELGHGVAVVPGGSEGVLLDEPAGREDDKVGDSCAGMVGGAGEHCVDGWIGVVEGSAADDGEPAKVILVWVDCRDISFLKFFTLLWVFEHTAR